jgi:hypothetical protein
VAQNATACVACDSGKSSREGSVMCIPCIPGSAGPSCDECVKGKYRGPKDTPDKCLRCEIGQYSNAASAVCSGCDLGRFGATAGTCVDCPLEQYQDTRGKTQCSGCPIGKAPNTLHTACERPEYKLPEDCGANDQYLNDASTNKEEWSCVPCPNGVDCSQPSSYSTLSMNATGFWNASWGVYPSFHKCPR